MTELLRTPAAAAYLDVHPNTLRALIQQGRIKAQRNHSRGPYRIKRTDLDAYIRRTTH